jgi:hypothetical protein
LPERRKSDLKAFTLIGSTSFHVLTQFSSGKEGMLYNCFLLLLSSLCLTYDAVNDQRREKRSTDHFVRSNAWSKNEGEAEQAAASFPFTPGYKKIQLQPVYE